MMMVKTELRPSPIHGLGVFLEEPVRKGGLIWRFDARIDRVFGPSELEGLPADAAEFLLTYSTFHAPTRLYVLCGDNGRFFNHADAPSTRSEGPAFGDDVAIRDLAPGEELTSDYRLICDRVRLEGRVFVDA